MALKVNQYFRLALNATLRFLEHYDYAELLETALRIFTPNSTFSFYQTYTKGDPKWEEDLANKEKVANFKVSVLLRAHTLLWCSHYSR